MRGRDNPTYFGSERDIQNYVQESIGINKFSEEVIGQTNGQNCTFKTSFPFFLDGLQVTDDGIVQSPQTDYAVINEMTIVFFTPPATGSKIVASYTKAV